MESDGDNTFLAAVGWAYRLLLSPLATQRVVSEGISAPKSNGMDYHDATPEPEPVVGSGHLLAAEGFSVDLLKMKRQKIYINLVGIRISLKCSISRQLSSPPFDSR